MSPAQFLLVRCFLWWQPSPCNRFEALEHGKRAGQETDIVRKQSFGLLDRQLLQVARQGVDQAVEGLVRNRLSLIAPPGENNRFLALQQLVEKRSNQRGLAGSCPAENEERNRLPPMQRGETSVQDLTMPGPPDQRERSSRLGLIVGFGKPSAQDAQ